MDTEDYKTLFSYSSPPSTGDSDIPISPNTTPFASSGSLPLPLSAVTPFSEQTVPLMNLDSYPPQFEFKSALPTGETAAQSAVGGGSGESFSVPHPMECLHETPIPPFLSKTFDLVDETSLNPIISWGAKGDSFVVWDPVEFARIILPGNFKHNNFSSFVRQLNTYGFRKIDTDKWEFANEGFLRGHRHLLKTIQRRRTSQSLQIGGSSGSSGETGKAALESELESLRKEKSSMMQAVVEMQHQQRNTFQHMEIVNEKLQQAEMRQKQMVSFLAKMLQNPTFVARLQQKEKKGITSPRTTRKFIKHQHERGSSESPREGRIIKYEPEVSDVAIPTVEQFPDYPLQSMEENFGFDESAMAHEFLQNHPGQGGGVSSLGNLDPYDKGKRVMNREMYLEELSGETNFLEVSSPGIGSIVKEVDEWNLGFEASAGMSSPMNELWGNVSSHDMRELGVSSGISDIWDIGSLQHGGISGMEMWSEEDLPINKLENQAGQPRDDVSQKMDP